MMRFTDLLISGDFACGAMYYADRYPEHEQTNLFVIPVIIVAHQQKAHAIVDTGSPWCVFDPNIIDFGAIQDDDTIQRERLMIRGTVYEGRLLRVGVRLDADTGEPLEVDATAFIPDLDDDEWLHPNFIGMEGLLSRICFAVDPYENTFYFGTV